MIIQLFNQTGENLSEYEQTIHHVFGYIKKKHTLNIIFVEDEDMIQLNQTYRAKEGTTDVLTFPSDSKLLGTIGDIFINILKVKEQAHSYGHSEQREVAFLAVHGYLHILGFDHHNDEDEKIMVQEQEKILEKAGLKRQ